MRFIFIAIEIHARTSQIHVGSITSPNKNRISAELIEGGFSSKEHHKRVIDHIRQIRGKYEKVTLVIDLKSNLAYEKLETLITENFTNIVFFRKTNGLRDWSLIEQFIEEMFANTWFETIVTFLSGSTTPPIIPV